MGCSLCGETLLPRDDEDLTTCYSCTNEDCTNTVTNDEAAQLETELEKLMDEVDSTNVAAIEKLVCDWSKKLHPQHFLVLLLKRKLVAALKLDSEKLTDKDHLIRHIFFTFYILMLFLLI